MFRTIRNLFTASPRSTETDAFVRALGKSDVFVIAATQSEGLDPKELTREKLLASLREALERDKEDQKTGHALFVYTDDGQKRLAFFTSNNHAQVFCGEYSKQRNRVFPFMVLGVKGSFLGRITSSDCDVVVMNDKSPDERVLSEDELALARRLWG